jgi:hypothetical protein
MEWDLLIFLLFSSHTASIDKSNARKSLRNVLYNASFFIELAPIDVFIARLEKN